MNIFKKIISSVAALATLVICSVPAFADTVKITTASEARNGVVWIQTDEGRGTGFAIGDPEKPVEYIVTNAHVVNDGMVGDKAAVIFSVLDDVMIATVVEISTTKDIAVLKLPEPTTLRTALVLCTSENIDLDDNFTALGFPFNSQMKTAGIDDVTMTRGAISKKTFYEPYGDYVYQMDVEIHPGNSGGPLVNSKGQVVGINSFSIPKTDQYGNKVNTNYSICVEEVTNLISQREYGYVLSTDVKSDPVESDPVESDPVESDPVKDDPDEDENEKGGLNTTMIIIIAAGVVVVAAVIIIAVTASSKKKKNSVASAPAPAHTQMAPTQAIPAQAAPAQSSSVIICEKGALAGRTFPLGSSVIMGRNPEKCGISFPVDTKGVSAVHCEIRKTANGYEIIDRGSSYGTMLGNGQKLSPNVPVYLPDGTYFSLGNTDQLFRIRY